jgi:hypothetical protein
MRRKARAKGKGHHNHPAEEKNKIKRHRDKRNRGTGKGSMSGKEDHHVRLRDERQLSRLDKDAALVRSASALVMSGSFIQTNQKAGMKKPGNAPGMLGS